MVAAPVFAVVAVALGVAWVMTGRSPFWWAAMGALFLEAVRAELFASMVPLARILVRRIRVRFVRVRAEIGIAA